MTRYVVMGVSGCGKSLIGAEFAGAIGARFVDGDDLHPQTNIDKMRRGIPLDDFDRAPWLASVGRELSPDQTVIACSALKRIYRDQIRTTAGAPVTFLFLRGPRETLLGRMASRPGHFMPASLLDSQLAALEPPAPDEPHLIQDIDQPVPLIVANLVAALGETSR